MNQENLSYLWRKRWLLIWKNKIIKKEGWKICIYPFFFCVNAWILGYKCDRMCKEKKEKRKVKKYIKNILTDNVLWIFTAITLIFFGTLYKMEFAVDTYATLSFTMKEFINQFA